MTDRVLKLNKSLEPHKLNEEVLQKLNRIGWELMEVEDKFNVYQTNAIKIKLRTMYEHWVVNQYFAKDEEE